MTTLLYSDYSPRNIYNNLHTCTFMIMLYLCTCVTIQVFVLVIVVKEGFFMMTVSFEFFFLVVICDGQSKCKQ